MKTILQILELALLLVAALQFFKGNIESATFNVALAAYIRIGSLEDRRP